MIYLLQLNEFESIETTTAITEYSRYIDSLNNISQTNNCGPHMDMNQHWVDTQFWSSITNKQSRERTTRLWMFIQSIPAIDNNSYNGRGVVYLVHGQSFKNAITSIRFLRHYGNQLPIELWYVRGELTNEQLEYARSIRNLSVMDLQEAMFKQKLLTLNIPQALSLEYEQGRNYHLKTLALILSRFKEIIYLDADNIPLQDPAALFDSIEYLQTGSLFWPDFCKYTLLRVYHYLQHRETV